MPLLGCQQPEKTWHDLARPRTSQDELENVYFDANETPEALDSKNWHRLANQVFQMGMNPIEGSGPKDKEQLKVSSKII